MSYEDHFEDENRVNSNDPERRFVPIDQVPDTDSNRQSKKIKLDFQKKQIKSTQEEEFILAGGKTLNEEEIEDIENSDEFEKFLEEEYENDKDLELAQEPGYYSEVVPILKENEQEPTVTKISGKESMGARYTNNKDLARLNIPSRGRRGEHRGDRENLKTITDPKLQKLRRAQIRKFLEQQGKN